MAAHRPHSSLPAITIFAPVPRPRTRVRRAFVSAARAALGATVLLASVHPVAAANQTWRANPGSNLFTDDNWTRIILILPRTGTISAGDDLIFNTSRVTTLNEDEAAGFNIGSFTFNSGADAFTISGNALTLSGGITNNSTNRQTINDAITLNGAQTFTTTTGGGDLTLGGTLTAAAGGFTVTGAGTVNLTGTGNTAQQITINTGATLDLGAGGITLGVATDGGTINAGTGGTINATGGGTLRLNGGTAGNGGDFGVAGTGSGTLRINAVIADGTQNNLDVYGSTAGTVIFGAANTYSGPTLVQRGTLRLADGLALQNSTLVLAGSNAPGTTGVVFDAAVTANAFTFGGLSSTDTSTDRNLVLQNNAPTPAAVALTVGNNGSSPTYAGVLSGPGSLTKVGTGTQTLSGANTYTGATLVRAGTLALDNAGAATAAGPRLGGTGRITVNNGGTLLLVQGGTTTASTDRIGNAVPLTLAGGTFATGGLSEGSATAAGLGALTLTATSVLDLGTGASILAFANSSGAAWTAGARLNVYNWTGSLSGGGTDEVFFGTSAAGLTVSELASIEFFSGGAGSTDLGSARILATGEIVPVPEPATVAAGLLALGALGVSQRRRLRDLLLPAPRKDPAPCRPQPGAA